MIVGFRHKGLKQLFEKDDGAGIRPDLRDRVRTILVQLDEATTIEDMHPDQLSLTRIEGRPERFFWSVIVRANWRIIFRFSNGEARDVELIDYH